jgi:hypothetical protein
VEAQGGLGFGGPRQQRRAGRVAVLGNARAWPGAGLVSILCLLVSACTNAVFEHIEDGGAPDAARDAAADAETRTDVRGICDAPHMQNCPSVAGGICDPVCQTGDCDWCTQKCSLVPAAGKDEPVAACVGMGKAGFAQRCSITASGSAQQSDDCARGSICLSPVAGAAAYCFNLCRSQSDCLSAVPCAPRPLEGGGVVSVCDPPPDQCGVDGRCCDPTTGKGCEADRFCLLVDPDPDPGSGHSRTVCEFSYGAGSVGSPCTLARDCSIMNVCVSNTCQQVCSSAGACPQGQQCRPWGGEFGYCS